MEPVGAWRQPVRCGVGRLQLDFPDPVLLDLRLVLPVGATACIRLARQCHRRGLLDDHRSGADLPGHPVPGRLPDPAHTDPAQGTGLVRTRLPAPDQPHHPGGAAVHHRGNVQPQGRRRGALAAGRAEDRRTADALLRDPVSHQLLHGPADPGRLSAHHRHCFHRRGQQLRAGHCRGHRSIRPGLTRRLHHCDRAAGRGAGAHPVSACCLAAGPPVAVHWSQHVFHQPHESLNRSKGMSQITIYHNPACGTSRNTLGLIRNSGEEPTVIEYLKTPPSHATLVKLLADAGLSVRDVLREKGTPYAELGLADPKWTDDQLLDFIGQHPILMNRPIVATPLGTKLCRPSETVLDILPQPQRGAFNKEDGEPVVDARGQRV